MNNSKTRHGFTLIELVVTILLAGICSLMAARLLVDAYRQYYTYRDRYSAFFTEYRNEIHFRKLIHEKSWYCREDGSFSFTEESEDSLTFMQAHFIPQCEKNLETGRILICLKPEVCIPGKQND